MKCSSCGNELSEGLSTCPACGAPVGAAAPAAAEGAAAQDAVQPAAAQPVAQPEAAAQPEVAQPEPAQPVAQPIAAQPVAQPAVAQPEATAQPVQPVAQPATDQQAANPASAGFAQRPLVDMAANQVPQQQPANPYAAATSGANPQPTSGPAGWGAAPGSGYAAPQQPANPYGAAPGAQPAGGAYAQQGAQQQYAQQPYGQPGYQQASGQYNQYGQPSGQPSYNQPPYGGAPYGAQQPIYPEGCLSAAAADLKASGSWAGKAALLGLINCVPILNFVTSGYILNWAREVPFGGRTPLPKSIVNGKNFEIGFYAFLVALVIGLVSAVASGILAFIPLIGWIAMIALSFFLAMIQVLSFTRIGMTQQLGEGFKVGAIFSVIKRNWTGLLCAAVVPQLIVGFVISIVWTIAVILMLPALFTGIGALLSYSTLEIAGALLAAFGAMGIFGIVVFLIAWVVTFMLMAVAQIISYRAVAHWVGRYASEWTQIQQPYGYGAPRY